jgi:hypothetical protein
MSEGSWVDRWVKNTVMLAVLLVWFVYMLTNLARGSLPEPALWGVPGGIWLALNPPFIGRSNNKAQEIEK